MIEPKLTSSSMYISKVEEQAIEELQRFLSAEEGYIIPVKFIGKQVSNREIDAILLLPDAIFLLDFKNWLGQRIEVEGLSGKVERLLHDGTWKDEHNSFPNYQYAARELGTQLDKWLKRERLLPGRPQIYSVMVFTSIGHDTRPPVSFAGGDPKRPEPKGGVGACRIEQLPQLIAAFRAAIRKEAELAPPQRRTLVQLNRVQQALLAKILSDEAKPPSQPRPRRIEGYVVIADHHTDTFLDCKIYLGEGEPIKEPVWIKEYKQVLAAPEQRSKREQLVLRHADILHRFPQHPNIVNYRTVKPTDSHLYVILSRKPGAFLSELLTGNPLDPTTKADLQRIPFDLSARLHILGGLLKALEYLTQQQGFEQSAYRDLRPDNIFVQFTDSTSIAQLFNFDCTKLPGAVTRLGHLKEGRKRSPIWEDYASPELLDYIESVHTTSGVPVSFTGDVSSDIFSWAIIAWELLTGEQPFSNTEAKLHGTRSSWPDHLAPHMQTVGSTLSPEAIHLIEACLELVPTSRPRLATLRSHFP